MRNAIFRSGLIMSALLLLSACSVPIRQSSVQLSDSVATQMHEMQALHILAINRYFDMEVEKVENFLTSTWEPLFLKNFLGTSGVIDLINSVSRIDDSKENQINVLFKEYLTDPTEADEATASLVSTLDQSRDKEEALIRDKVTAYIEDDKIEAVTTQITALLGTDNAAQIIFEFAEAAHYEMSNKRSSLIQPIEQERSEIIAELSQAYAQMIKGQSTITGRLAASAKVSDGQDQLIQSLQLSDIAGDIQGRLSSMTSKIDNALHTVNGLIDGAEGSDQENLIDILQKELLTISKKN